MIVRDLRREVGSWPIATVRAAQDEWPVWLLGLGRGLEVWLSRK
jgi:hypothetical protein